MTEHSIKELERQVNAARGRLNTAQNELTEARARLYAAREAKATAEYAEQGIHVGGRVCVYDSGINGNERRLGEAIFVGFSGGYGDIPEPSLKKVKKDGSASQVRFYVPWKARMEAVQ